MSEAFSETFQDAGLQIYEYKTLAKVISSKFYGIIQNNFSTKRIRVTVSDTKQRKGQNKSSIQFKCCKLNYFTW